MERLVSTSEVYTLSMLDVKASAPNASFPARVDNTLLTLFRALALQIKLQT